MPYLIQWIAEAIPGTTRVENEDELVGFLLALPGDGSFVVREVTEVTDQS